MNVQIGTAPDSWGVWFPSDPRQTPWDRFMDEAAEAGYEWIELGPYGYLPTDLSTLQRELNRRKLGVTATFVMKHLEDAGAWPAIEQEVIKTGEVLTALGARFLVLIDDTYTDLFTGQATRPETLDDAGWRALIETTHKVADLAGRRFGLKTVFHPHTDHVQHEAQIEKLLEDTDPERVFLCLDTGHHAYRGGDPVRFMRKHHQRIPYLHLKSIDTQVQKRVEAENIPFAKAVAMDMFCEPSQGGVNFAAFRNVLEEINYDGWGTVEQDMYPAPFDKPFPIAKQTRDYLRSIGVG